MSENILTSIEKIRQFLLNNKKPSYQTTNKKEIRVRCPYCGDSSHDASAAHFYIEMKPPFRFHCFKCETSGVLTQNVLRDLSVYETEIGLELLSARKEQKNLSGIAKLNYQKHSLKNEVVRSQTTVNSVLYINNRLGTSYNAKELISKFKAVLDPPFFIKENSLYISEKITFDFSKAVGFISADSSHIIFRDISGEQKTRYFNLSVSNNEESPVSKTYNIAANINVMEPTLKLVLTEGIFDSIGVYSNIYSNKNKENIVFAAACGKSYLSVILHYIHLGFLNLEIEIFSDGDVQPSFFQEMKSYSPYLKGKQITIYYNSLYNPKTKENKDFGGHSENIQLRKIII